MYHLITDAENLDTFAIIDDITKCWHGDGEWGTLQFVVLEATEDCHAADTEEGPRIQDFTTVEEYCKALMEDVMYISTIHLAKAEHPSDFLTKFPELLI